MPYGLRRTEESRLADGGGDERFAAGSVADGSDAKSERAGVMRPHKKARHHRGDGLSQKYANDLSLLEVHTKRKLNLTVGAQTHRSAHRACQRAERAGRSRGKRLSGLHLVGFRECRGGKRIGQRGHRI